MRIGPDYCFQFDAFVLRYKIIVLTIVWNSPKTKTISEEAVKVSINSQN